MSMLLSFGTSWRSARARPIASAAVLLILALSIGSTTAIYSLVEAVLLRQMPVREPERLVWMWNARLERDRAPFSWLDLQDYREGTSVLDGLASFTNWTANLTGVGDPERVEGIRVDAAFFTVLGVNPAAGRLFGEQDGPGQTVVLTDNLWRRRFGGDRTIVGRSVALNGAGYTVVGILPAGFAFPFRDAELAVPLVLDADPRRADRGAGFLRVVARLRTGVTLDRAKTDLDAIGRRLQRMYPDADAKKTGVNLFPLDREMVGDARALLLTLLAAVLLVLIVACTNIAALLLAMWMSRRRELSIRIALGASRRQIASQVLLEIVWLVVAGATAGLQSARGFIHLLVWWGGPALPRLDEVGLTPPVVGAAVITAALAAAICGLAPALLVSRTPAAGLAESGRGASAGRLQRRWNHAFVCAQIAATLVLLLAAALTIRNFVSLSRVDPGFTPRGVLSIQLSLPPVRYASVAAIATFADRLRGAIRDEAGIRDVTAVSLLPLSGLLSTVDYRVVGRPEPQQDEIPQAHYRIAMPEYFRVMGIPLVAGREFTDDDRDMTKRAAVVSRAFATRHWRDSSPVGEHIVVGRDTLEVVGVCADVKQFGPDAPPTADLYVPLRQAPAGQAPFVASRMYWVLRVGGDPMRVAEAVRREIRRADPEVASSSIRTTQQILAASVGPRQFNARLLELLGGAGLLLSVLGVYAATAFSVRLRTREIAIRVACGATPGRVMRQIVLSEMPAIALGLALGLTIATRVSGGAAMAAPLAAALGGVAMFAAYLPARRVAAIDPTRSLHEA